MNTKGFFEMEMVSLDEIREFEENLKDCGVAFVSDMSMENNHLASSYSAYADFQGTGYDEDELVSDESAFGYDNLKMEYEEMFG